MIFKTKEDVEAPIDYVFGIVSDFDALERQALRRGAEVRRLDAGQGQGGAPAWDIAFAFRGRQRRLRVTVQQIDPPHGYSVAGKGDALQGNTVIDLLPLSRHRTRISASVEVQPLTLRGRLLVQSMRLGKSGLERKFRQRVADYARTVEERFRQNPPGR